MTNNKKYSKIEGLEELTRSLLMMKYDTSKTLNEQTAYEFQLDRTFSDPKKASEYIKSQRQMVKDIYHTIKGASVSEVLLKAREYFFTPGGMTVQIFLSIAGSEVGAPLVFTVLDIAILINDLILMSNNWKPYQSDTEENWFIYQWENNQYFQNSVVDIGFILTGGALKLAGMGAKAAYKGFVGLLEKWGLKSISKGVEKIVTKISEQKWKIDKLPEPIKSWTNKFLGKAESAFNLWKTPTKALKSVTKKSIPASVAGGVTYYGTKKLESYLDNKNQQSTDVNKILGGDSEEQKYKIDDEIIECIMMDNPGMFSEKPKITCVDKKCLTMIINGKEYIYSDKETCKIQLTGNGVKINTTNDNNFDYKLENGKYYFKGKGDKSEKYPDWVEAKGKGLESIKNNIKF